MKSAPARTPTPRKKPQRVGVADYESASLRASVLSESKAEKFLREVGALREKFGDFDDDFSPEPLDLRAQTAQF